MSPLEALLRMTAEKDWSIYQEYSGYDSYDLACLFCNGYHAYREPFRHDDDCPTRAIPQIITALEAAERREE